MAQSASEIHSPDCSTRQL